MAGDRNAAAPIGKRGGTLISTPYAGGPITQQDTVCCQHCSYSSVWVTGSEKWWSICQRCGGLRCGRECCQKNGCIPQEQEIENMEAGRPDNFRRIVSRPL